MQRRRRIKHTLSLEERLAEEAKRLREEAKKLPPAPTREGLLRKAREDEMVAHLAERITSLVLAAPQISQGRLSRRTSYVFANVALPAYVAHPVA
jgi:hypothetical protein